MHSNCILIFLQIQSVFARIDEAMIQYKKFQFSTGKEAGKQGFIFASLYIL